MFFITTVGQVGQYGYNSIEHRVIGFYSTIDKVFNVIEKDSGALWEHRYNFVVVEEFQEGVYTDSKQEIWFRWCKNKNKWIHLKNKPERFNTSNWAIG